MVLIQDYYCISMFVFHLQCTIKRMTDVAFLMTDRDTDFFNTVAIM